MERERCTCMRIHPHIHTYGPANHVAFAASGSKGQNRQSKPSARITRAWWKAGPLLSGRRMVLSSQPKHMLIKAACPQTCRPPMNSPTPATGGTTFNWCCQSHPMEVKSHPWKANGVCDFTDFTRGCLAAKATTTVRVVWKVGDSAQKPHVALF